MVSVYISWYKHVNGVVTIIKEVMILVCFATTPISGHTTFPALEDGWRICMDVGAWEKDHGCMWPSLLLHILTQVLVLKFFVSHTIG